MNICYGKVTLAKVELIHALEAPAFEQVCNSLDMFAQRVADQLPFK